MQTDEKEQETIQENPDTPAEQQDEEKDSYSFKNFIADIMDIAEAAILTVFLFLLVFAYLLRPVTVDGGSMNPTLYDQDNLLILTSLPKPKNGQIIVMDNQISGRFIDDAQTKVLESEGSGLILIKRLIAQGGQEVDIDFETGTVKVDGNVLDEPYIAALTTRNDGAFTYPFTVPEGYIFAMGDNRLNSTDSRNPAVSLIPEREILGTVLVRYDRDDELCADWKDRFAFLF